MSGEKTPAGPPPGGEDPAPTEVGGAPASAEAFASAVLRRLAGRGSGVERYQLEGELARGGQGAIVRVWDADLERHLAMKVILEGGAPGAGSTPSSASRSLGRFIEEAQVTGRLDHPGIVPVHELGLDAQGRVYFTMKLVQGRELRSILDRVRDGTEGWTVTRALGLLLKVCEAMAYAHSKGVIHRDLKPSNVMVGRFGEVYVMDWGLALMRDREDTRDLRIRRPQPDPKTGAEREAGESGGSPLLTMDGDVIGTPSYMSPEQASGERGRVGPRSDVYSVGAMLYHLLAGQAPYERPGVKQDNYAVLGLLQEGPPTALHELARDQPAELVAICEKAMARVEQDRYADMMELAEDLRAWLEGRVVRAYRTGALAELRKWVARNPQLAAMSAAALVLLVAGLAAVGYVQSRGREAAERERAVAERERGNVLRLSAFQKMADLRAEAEELWPAAPGRIADYERWLAEAAGLAPELDFARAQRDELRARALPLTAEERQRSHAMHPRYAQLVALQAERAALARAQAVRRGEDEPEAVELDMGVLPDGSHELASLAWPLVEPARTEFGRETEGLALAREALERARNDDDRSRSGRALAWASFACGLDEQALETAWRVRDGVGEALLGQAEDLLAEVEAAVHGAQQGEVAARLAQLDAELPALEAAVDERLLWTFEHDEDRWWHEQLTKLIGELEAFFDAGTGLVRGTSPESGWGIERRLDFARRVQESSVDGPDARRRWDEAIASIADERECPAYGGLRIRPQLGLLPVGRDPDSGLWEFVHLQSGSVPARDAQGRLVLEQDTGIVLVLLPAGTFWMGAQATDPEAPDYDPAAAPDEEPVHQVTLWPFFLARHELTQSQWTGFTGSNPSTYTDDFPGEEASDGGLHPVENVSWVECDRVLRQMGLLLPTEAQWEYGARGGTQTPWWTGAQRESLAGAVNFGDAAALRFGAIWPALSDWLDDGFAVHAHAGGLSANAFGLEQVHGNVGEWCRERWSSYTAPHALGDGERHPTGFPNRIVRGGAFVFPVDASRVTARPAWESTYRSNFIGARAARPLER